MSKVFVVRNSDYENLGVCTTVEHVKHILLHVSGSYQEFELDGPVKVGSTKAAEVFISKFKGLVIEEGARDDNVR